MKIGEDYEWMSGQGFNLLKVMLDPEIENLPDDSFLKEKKENVDGQWKEKEAINTFSSLSNKGIGKVSGSISSSFPFTFDHDVINCFSN